MKSTLLIGLGNPLAGNDGIGRHIAELLAKDPHISKNIEVILGGTDLLRHEDSMAGRTEVILIDAILDGAEPGTVRTFDDEMLALEGKQGHAHHLSPVQAVRLLREIHPSLRATRFRLISISIPMPGVGSDVSPSLISRLPEMMHRVYQELFSP